MKAIVVDFFKPNSIDPKTVENLYKIATEKVYTDINITDMKILFDVLTNYQYMKIETISLDTTNYLMIPNDKWSYGGEWVLIGKYNNYIELQKKITELLNQ